MVDELYAGSSKMLNVAVESVKGSVLGENINAQQGYLTKCSKTKQQQGGVDKHRSTLGYHWS